MRDVVTGKDVFTNLRRLLTDASTQRRVLRTVPSDGIL